MSIDLDQVYNNIEIKHIFIGKGFKEDAAKKDPLIQRVNTALKNLKEALIEIGKKEGFKVSSHRSIDLGIRDAYIRGKTGYFIPNKGIKALGNLYLKQMNALQSPKSCHLSPSHEDYQSYIQPKASMSTLQALLEIGQLPKFKSSALFFEGGNFVQCYDIEGNPIAGGCSNLDASYLLWQQNGKFLSNEMIERVNEMMNNLKEKKLFTEELLTENQKYLFNAGFYRDRDPQDFYPIKIAIAQVEVIKKEFEKELGVPIIWVPDRLGFGGDQPGFHIDMHLTPLFKKVCIQSSTESLKTIETIFQSHFSAEDYQIFETGAQYLEEIAFKYRSMKYELINNNELNQNKKQLDEYKKQLDEYKEELDEYNEELDEYNEELDEYKKQLDEYNKKLDEYNKKLDQQKNYYYTQKKQIFNQLALKIESLKGNFQLFSELFTLYSYRLSAIELDKQESQRIQEVTETLQRHGLEPILVPAHYSKKIRVANSIVYRPYINYSNAIVGKGKLGSFFISLGFKSKAEKHLLPYFEKIIKENGVKNTYFIKDEGTLFLKSWGGGIHCLTNV
jgi:hypothetical protein